MIDEARGFGAWLKQCRKALDLTQAELAQRVGCSVRTIEKFETGERRPSKQLAALLIHHLQIPPDEHATFMQRARAQPALAPSHSAPATQAPAGSAIPSHRHNLPAPPTALVGRKTELVTACALLRRPYGRLLTLTGPGGIGKTRLALEVASELLDDFPDGVFFVPLAPLGDPELVLSTVAWTLGIKEQQGESPFDSLKRELRTKQVLLVLDNFEHLLPAAVHVAELLAACPDVKVLVTSLEVLHLRGEKELPVPPLTLPDATQMASAEHVYHSEAVHLFVERAQDARLDFVITNENAPAVAEICVRLDGLPLAIELAAARIHLLPPQALLPRLSSRLKLLTGGHRDLPARQQTLRGAIAWSYDLLDAGEQQLFARPAVFVGSRTLEAVEAVCNAEGDLELDVLDGIASLVDKSLLRQEAAQADEPRFVMLETIHEYAREQLEASGEAEAVRRWHALYFLQLAETAEPHLTGPAQVAWLQRLEAEYDNLRAALQWTLGTEATPAANVKLGGRLAASLGQFWDRQNHPSEGRQWLERALEQDRHHGAVDVAVRAALCLWLGQLTERLGDLEAARTHWEKSAALYRQLGDKQGTGRALSLLGNSVWRDTGDAAAGLALVDESLALAREVGDKWGLAFSHLMMGTWAFGTGDTSSGCKHYEQSLALARESGDKRQIARGLLALGIVAASEGDVARGRAYDEEALVVSREIGDKVWTACALNNLGFQMLQQEDVTAAQPFLEEAVTLIREVGNREMIGTFQHSLALAVLAQGDSARAAALLKDSLLLFREMGSKGGFTFCLEGMAEVAVARKQDPVGALRAARLLAAAWALREAIDDRHQPTERSAYVRVVATVRAELDEATWEQAWAEGQSMTIEQAVEYALGGS